MKRQKILSIRKQADELEERKKTGNMKAWNAQ